MNKFFICKFKQLFWTLRNSFFHKLYFEPEFPLVGSSKTISTSREFRHTFNTATAKSRHFCWVSSKSFLNSGSLYNKWIKAESFYHVKYWNINYYVKCLSENCWFLVCCFFSVIWNISEINVFKTKCKSKCQNDFSGKLFLKSGNTSVYISCFHYWDLSDKHLTW